MKNGAGYLLVNAVMSTADAFLREGQRLFRPHGLTGAQFNVLNVLGDHPAGLSQRELSEWLVVDRSNVEEFTKRINELRGR